MVLFRPAVRVLPALLALLVPAALVLGLSAGEARAITYATSVTPQFLDPVAAGRGTDTNRDDPLNATGAPDGAFFEIGLNGYVDFGFGGVFSSPGTVVEITFGTRTGFVEYATVEVGLAGGGFVEVNESPISNQAPLTTFTFTGGPFDTVRLRNADGTTVSRCGPSGARYDCGGFDVDAIGVNLLTGVVETVPLPMPLALMLASLAGIGLLARRRA